MPNSGQKFCVLASLFDLAFAPFLTRNDRRVYN